MNVNLGNLLENMCFRNVYAHPPNDAHGCNFIDVTEFNGFLRLLILGHVSARTNDPVLKRAMDYSAHKLKLICCLTHLTPSYYPEF
jgi:hypothetical protein